MPTAVARVKTDNPQRYAKQLCEHLGRRSTTEYADGKGLIYGYENTTSRMKTTTDAMRSASDAHVEKG